MTPDEIYYLSSLESTTFAEVRECHFLRFVEFESGKVAVEAHIRPGVVPPRSTTLPTIDNVVLSCRHQGATLAPIDEFPCFVHIAVPRAEGSMLNDGITADDLVVIGWGELYRTREDAVAHRFES